MSDMLEMANHVAVKAEFRIASEEAGVLETALDDAFVLADLSGVSIDDEGKVHGVREAVQALSESKPYLFSQRVPAVPKRIGEGTNHDYRIAQSVNGSGKSPRTAGKEYGFSSVHAKASVDKRFREDLERLGIKWR